MIITYYDYKLGTFVSKDFITDNSENPSAIEYNKYWKPENNRGCGPMLLPDNVSCITVVQKNSRLVPFSYEKDCKICNSNQIKSCSDIKSVQSCNNKEC